METVEQIMINNLQTEIKELNRKIILNQTEHYRKQKMMIDKYEKGVKGAVPEPTSNDKELISVLQINLETEKKKVELINQELEE
jgi:hypothetical protein